MTAWQQWLEKLEESEIYTPTVYDRFSNEVDDPAWQFCWPTTEQILAKIDEPETTDEDEANMVISCAVGEIWQCEQNAIDDEAERAEHAAWLAKEQTLNDLHDLVAGSLNHAGDRFDWHFAASGSRYLCYRSLVKLRVADHRQVAGGGWNAARGERAGEADVDFYVGGKSWDRDSIRAAVADAIRNNR